MKKLIKLLSKKYKDTITIEEIPSKSWWGRSFKYQSFNHLTLDKRIDAIEKKVNEIIKVINEV